MKKLIAIVLIALSSVMHYAQNTLAVWNKANFTPSTSNNHITVGSLTASGVGMTVENVYFNGSSYNAFKTTNWSSPMTGTVDPNKYMQFTISPNHGYKMTLSEFKFYLASYGDGKVRVDYSLDKNFAPESVVNALPASDVIAGMKEFSVTNFVSPLATDGQVVYVRVYIYNTWQSPMLLFKEGTNVGPTFIGNVTTSSSIPVAHDDHVTTTINNDIDIPVLTNDDYSNQVNYIQYSGAAHGTLTLNPDNTINYLPHEGYTGTDSFVYSITNNYGTSNIATVNIEVKQAQTSVLALWDSNDYKPTTSYSFIERTPIQTSNLSLSLGNEQKPVFIISGGLANNTLDPNKYIQFVFSNASAHKAVQLDTFSLYGRGYNPGKYEIHYSKNEDFSDSVVLEKGEYSSSYERITVDFSDVLVLPSEKVYIRFYAYNNPSNYIIQYSQGSEGPSINGKVYYKDYLSDTTIWMDANNPHWSNGAPSPYKNAIIETNYSTLAHGNFECKNLTVRANANLVIASEDWVAVHGKITNEGDGDNFIIEHDGNLNQLVDVENTGEITVKKLALIPKMGYNYWTSPVKGQNLYRFSDGYNQAITTGSGTPWNRFYVYNEATDYFVTKITNEITLNENSTFLPGRGYAIRGKNSSPETITETSMPELYTFKGVPQNGVITDYILKWSGPNKGYNLVGNPYPSNINFDEFYEINRDKINGAAYFWTNNDQSITTQQGSNYSGNNYAIYNSTGGAAATYKGYNNKKPNGNIAVGQGFIIQTNEAGKNQPLTFTNKMRRVAVATYFNKGNNEKNRFWVELKSPIDINNEILIGYVEGATAGFDKDYDAELLSIASDSFWSVLGASKLAIQAKDVFNNEDEIALGFKASTNGDYTIKLNEKEGLFNGSQNVYIKDTYLNKTVNVTDGAYTFYTEAGTFEDRFKIVYKSTEYLGTTDIPTQNGIKVYSDLENFVVEVADKLDEIDVYDGMGRAIYNIKPNAKKASIKKINLPEGIYILKIKSGNQLITKKVVK